MTALNIANGTSGKIVMPLAVVECKSAPAIVVSMDNVPSMAHQSNHVPAIWKNAQHKLSGPSGRLCRPALFHVAVDLERPNVNASTVQSVMMAAVWTST